MTAAQASKQGVSLSVSASCRHLQAPPDRRDVLRRLAARYARYLIGYSMLTDVPFPLNAVKVGL